MDEGLSYNRIILQVFLTEKQKKILADKSKKERPNESCALLLGITDNEKIVVKEVFLTDNQDKSPVNFTISPEQLLQGYQKAEKNDLDVVAIFHSHPYSDPYPTATDKKFMKINPVPWIIFSGVTNDFKAYVLESDVIEVPVISS